VLKDGDLKQVGTPIELYERPANVFVASFIGTPPMNLVGARVASDGSGLEATGFAIPAPPRLRGATARYAGRNVVMGIRPENVREAGSEIGGGTARVGATVEIVEPLGNEVVVHASVGEAFLVAKFDPHRAPKLGDRVDLVLELDALHLFDAETEARLE